MTTMHELQIKMHQVSGVEVVEMAGAIDALAFSDLSATLGRMIAEVTPMCRAGMLPRHVYRQCAAEGTA